MDDDGGACRRAVSLRYPRTDRWKPNGGGHASTLCVVWHYRYAHARDASRAGSARAQSGCHRCHRLGLRFTDAERRALNLAGVYFVAVVVTP